MGVPKNLWEKKDSSLQEKKTIEALIERLNKMIEKNPKSAKKAALIIEEWLKKQSKP
jgi:hypothetical protein